MGPCHLPADLQVSRDGPLKAGLCPASSLPLYWPPSILYLIIYTFLWISRTLYFMIPEGISTSTTSPVCAPIRAFPTGDSLEILPSRLLASVDPTIFSSISSSNS